MARSPHQQSPTIQYNTTINVNHIVIAQTDDQARVGSLLSFMTKTIGGLWPFQAGGASDNPSLLSDEDQDDESDLDSNSLATYAPPPSAPCTPTKKPFIEQGPSKQLEKRLLPRSQAPQTPRRVSPHPSGLPTPDPSPRFGICQATVISHGEPCRNKALSDSNYLVCGKHWGQFAGIQDRLALSDLSTEHTNPRSVSSSSTPTRSKQPSTSRHSSPQQPSSHDERVLVTPRSRTTTEKCRCVSETRSKGHKSPANIQATKPRSVPNSRGNIWTRRDDLQNELVPNHLTKKTQDVICKTLIKGPSPQEGPGYIYCFEDRDLSGSDSLCLKIGLSTDPEERFRQWKARKCNPDEPISKFHIEVSHRFLIEKLVHLHVADLERNAQHLYSDLDGKWATGPSISPEPRIPYSDESPFKPYGIPCTSCNVGHLELFQIGVFPRKGEYDENAEEKAGRENLTVELVQRVVEYWADVASRVLPETP